MYRACKKKRRMKTTIRFLNKNGIWIMRPQRPNSIWNKRQVIRQGRAFNRKNRKAGKLRLRAFILYFYFGLSVETTRTNINPPGKREVPPAPIFLNPKSRYGTEETGHQLGSDKVSSFTMEIRVSTIEDSLNN